MKKDFEEYRNFGDVKKIADLMNVTSHTVLNVLNGRTTNKRISHAIQTLIDKRKKEREELVTEINNEN